MTKFANPGLMPTSRRNVLRGSFLAGAAAFTGVAAGASPRRALLPNTQEPSARFLEAEAQAQVQAPAADLSGYTRVKQELVAPPFAPAHEQVATGGPKIIEIYMETTERLMVVDEDTGASVWALTYNGSVPGPLII